MELNLIKKNLSRNLSNIPGWSTKRKIVVIESDDWGSIRMSSLNAFNKLKQHVSISDRMPQYDSLECNKDLEYLLEVLLKHRDSVGKNPVITTLNLVTNPDFKKIREENFSSYHYEPFTETLKRYPEHDNVYNLWKEAIKSHLLIPQFHGREHLNVQRWLKALSNQDEITMTAFNDEVVFSRKDKVFDFQAAFDVDHPQDLVYMREVLNTGLDLFKELYGYKSTYCVPPNGSFNNSLEGILENKGVKYINSSKIQKEPLGFNQYRKHIRFIGQKNAHSQIYLTRNCFFEPSKRTYSSSGWTSNCLKEIEIAFNWKKPAIISSHRVNYAGFLHPENRANGLKKLDLLLSEIIKQWPMVEFMTSAELGDLIAKS
jgi:hypothetical protein